jgi:hypothetical protein
MAFRAALVVLLVLGIALPLTPVASALPWTCAGTPGEWATCNVENAWWTVCDLLTTRAVDEPTCRA